MDKIYLNQMAFYGFHGVFPEEKKLGQRFLVDVILEVDLKRAGKTDDLNQSVDYGLVYQLTKQIVEGRSKNLIEAVAEEIAETLLTQFTPLKACTIKVIKPDPPIPGHYQSVAVEVHRMKSI